jgi:hypothetical protein
MLLAALGTRRPTADIDLLASAVRSTLDAVADMIVQILQIPTDDGVEYEAGRLSARVIRDTELYAGVRITVPARLDRARAVLRADINVGDPVTPGPVEIDYPGLLKGSFRLLGYPLATVLAEKLVTMIDRAETTTRERDFADVVLLTRRHPISGAELLAALRATAQHRDIRLQPITDLPRLLGPARQTSWSAYLARNGLAGQLPADYAAAISAAAAFLDPVLSEAGPRMWNPATGTWTKS